MKNNQFKKVIRNCLEELCLVNNYKLIYVDYSNNERLYYVYDSNFKIKGTISCFLNKTEVSLKYAKGSLVTISNRNMELRTPYTKLNDIIKFIKKVTKEM